MKRMRDRSIERSAKKFQSNQNTELQLPWEMLPADMWKEINGYLNTAQGVNLISTSSFFRVVHHSFKQSLFLERIQKFIFDYSYESELNNIINLPVDPEGFTKVINHFVGKLQAVLPEIIELKFRLDFSTSLDFDDSNILFEPEKTDIDEFLQIIGAAVREGNLLILKQLKESLPVYMEHCINDVDQLGMTPLAYAAALDRKNICHEILLNSDEPFQNTVKYKLIDDCEFSLRSIHIFALRSNKELLLTILKVYFDSLEKVFNKTFEEALWDILKNDVKSLKAKLDTDNSLLGAIDEESWTLAQWASCFPDAKDCLQLLIDKKAVLSGEKSPPIAYIACAAGNLPGLNLLKDTGVSIKPLENGNSLLHLSAYLGHVHITEELVENYNQDVNLTNSNGKTPLFFGRTVNHYGVDLPSDTIAKKMLCVDILLNNKAIDESNVPTKLR